MKNTMKFFFFISDKHKTLAETLNNFSGLIDLRFLEKLYKIDYNIHNNNESVRHS